MPRPEKVQMVEQLEELFRQSHGCFVTDYQGLNVADINALRRDFRANKVRFLVAKNTLLRRAARAVGMDQLEPFFRGPTAVAFAQEDPAVAAKIIYDSYKEKELPRVKAFVVDDQLFEADDIKRLADLPPRDVLLAQVAAAIESPLTSLVGALDGVFRELVGTLDALAEKKKTEG